MARVTLNDAFKGFTGLLGRISIYEWDGDTFARACYKRKDPKTPLQLDLRGAFGKAVKSWQGLNEKEQAYWNKMSKKRRVKGYHLYISAYMLNRWDRLEGSRIRPDLATADAYFDTEGSSAAVLQGSSNDAPVFIRSMVVDGSMSLKNSGRAGITGA